MRFFYFFILIYLSNFLYLFFANDLNISNFLMVFNLITIMLFYMENKKINLLDRELYYFVPIHYLVALMSIITLNYNNELWIKIILYFVNFLIVTLYLKYIKKK